MMFKAVISRDGGEPWGPTGMTSAKWLGVPLQMVRIGDLIATQPGLLIEALAGPTSPVGGDAFPHVIRWRDGLYL